MDTEKKRMWNSNCWFVERHYSKYFRLVGNIKNWAILIVEKFNVWCVVNILLWLVDISSIGSRPGFLLRVSKWTTYYSLSFPASSLRIWFGPFKVLSVFEETLVFPVIWTDEGYFRSACRAFSIVVWLLTKLSCSPVRGLIDEGKVESENPANNQFEEKDRSGVKL